MCELCDIDHDPEIKCDGSYLPRRWSIESYGSTPTTPRPVTPKEDQQE